MRGSWSDSFSIILILRIIRVLLLSRLMSGKISRALVMFSSVVRRSIDVLELMLIYLVVGMVVFGPSSSTQKRGRSTPPVAFTCDRPSQATWTAAQRPPPFTSIPQCFYWW